jgi:hypothetical protein
LWKKYSSTFWIFTGVAERLNYPVMENESLIRFLKRKGVVIEKPGHTFDTAAQVGRPFTLEPLTDYSTLERGSVLGCIFGIFVMAAAGLILFAGIHALITGRAF